MAEYTLPISLFFRGNKVFGAGEIKFDLLLNESHDIQSVVTTHPVEDGSVIADHIQNSLFSGGITGLITNFSIYEGELGGQNRGQQAFDALIALWEEKTLVDIVTVYKVYRDAAILSMPIARDSDSGESLIVQINFQQVKKVKLQQVEIELAVKTKNNSTNKNRQISSKVNAGRTTTTTEPTGITDIL